MKKILLSLLRRSFFNFKGINHEQNIKKLLSKVWKALDLIS